MDRFMVLAPLSIIFQLKNCGVKLVFAVKPSLLVNWCDPCKWFNATYNINNISVS